MNSLKDYEADPSFASLSPEDRDAFYVGYFDTKRQEAKTEDDFNNILKEDADRKFAALQTEYKASFPEDTKFEPNKLGEGFTMKFNDVNKQYGELYANTTGEIKTIPLKDDKDPTRAFAYKPFYFEGRQGYTVKYPDGTVESLADLEDLSQLTDFVKTKRAKNFRDQDEITNLYDQVNNTESGFFKGKINAVRKGWSGMLQAFDVMDIDNKSQGLARQNKALNEIKAKMLEDSKIANDAPDTEMGKAAKERFNQNAKAYASMYDPKMKALQEKNLHKAYASLIDEMQASANIKGDMPAHQFEKYMAAQPKDKQGDAYTFAEYFGRNPSQVLPYVASVAASAIPDIGAAVGLGAATGAAGAGLYGFAREYSATLLSEIQVDAAEKGIRLTEETFQGYISDEDFMQKVRNKAKTRASVIGIADAVLGGAVEKILKSAKSGLKKTVSGALIGTATEGFGELGAQYATGPVNFTEVFNEMLGGPAAGPMTFAANQVKSFKDKVMGKKEDLAAKAQAAAEGKVPETAKPAPDVSAGVSAADAEAKAAEAARVQEMINKMTQEDRNMADFKKSEMPNYDPKADDKLTPEQKEAADVYLKSKAQPAPAIIQKDVAESPSTEVQKRYNDRKAAAAAELEAMEQYSSGEQPTGNPPAGAVESIRYIPNEAGMPPAAPVAKSPNQPSPVPSRASQERYLAREAQRVREEAELQNRQDNTDYSEPPPPAPDAVASIRTIPELEAAEPVEMKFPNVPAPVPSKAVQEMVRAREAEFNRQQEEMNRDNTSDDTSNEDVPLPDGVVESGRPIPEVASQLTEESEPVTTQRPMTEEGATEIRNNAPVTEVAPEAPILQEEDNLTETFDSPEKTYTFTEKALDFIATKFGLKVLPENFSSRQKAAELFANNPLAKGIFTILKDRRSFDRIMKEARDSNYDEGAQGRLMEAMGLSPQDTNRRVITNILGDFWMSEAKPGNSDDSIAGFYVGQAISKLYEQIANVANYNTMPLGDLEGISTADILLNFAPDGMVQPVDGTPSEYPLQSGPYEDMSNEEAVLRMEKSLQASIVRAREYDPKLDNKYHEALTMNREGIKVLKLDKLGSTPIEIADNIIRAYEGRSYVLKDAEGANSVGLHFSEWFKSAVELAEVIKKIRDEGKLDRYYTETAVYLDSQDSRNRGNSNRFEEYRVHLYVDKNDVAHVFKNLTYNKRRSMYDLVDRGKDPNQPDEDTLLIIADSPNDPVVATLQKHAAQLMSGKPAFRDMIFGLDMSMVAKMNEKGSFDFSPFAFEANGLTYGMSGWLGRPLPMSEMMSEFTGKPSAMAGLYEIAKLNMSASQLTEINNAIDAGMPAEYAANPEYYDAIQKGAALFNRYVPVEKWLAAMRRAVDVSDAFLSKLWATISGVFHRMVDPAFKAARKGDKPSNEARGPKGGYRIDGIQKGFGGVDGNEWVPMYQNVTIIDSTHPFDGSTMTIPLNGQAQLTESQIQTAVDAKRKQNVNPAFKTSKALADMYVNVKSKTPISLRQYINQLLQHPNLNEGQRLVLQYVLKNAGRTRLNEVKVSSTKAGYSSYDSSKAKVNIATSETNIKTAIHEVIHAVTSDFLSKNLHNLATLSGTEVNNASDMMGALYQLTEPANRGKMITQGINPLYIDVAASYISFLESIGITRENYKATGTSPVGVNSNSAYQHVADNPSIPYAAVSLDEYLAEAMSNDKFQAMLAKQPSVFTKTKNKLMELFDMIAGMIGIPFTKASALSDAVLMSKEIIKHRSNRKLWRDMSAKMTGYGVEIFRGQQDAEMSVRETAGVPHLKNELPAPVAQKVKAARLQSQKDTAAKEVAEAVLKARFDKLKKAFPVALRGLDFNGSLAEAREKVIDALDSVLTETEDANGKEISDKKIQAAIEMAENKALALHALKDLINHPSITASQARILVDSMDYAMKKSSDPVNMTTNQIKYYSNVFASLTDGGVPTGFKHIAARQFKDTWIEEFYNRGLTDLDFSMPISEWRNKPFFGLAGRVSGGLSSQAAEINLIGKTREGMQFLQDLMGTMKDNIDAKQLAEKALVAEFYENLQAAFPKGSFQPINDIRIGLIARLTQWNKNSKVSPLAQMSKRFTQLTESLPLMKDHDTEMHDLTQKALADMIGTTDIAAFPDANAAVAHLEAQLTAAERQVLYKLRDIGQRLYPSLQIVKAISKKAVLDDWHNYIHDSSSTPKESTEENSMSDLNSLQDVLSEREGFDPMVTYPNLQISAIAEHQIKASTYEQHTGVERYILNSALDEKGALSAMLDKGHTGRPVSDRLRNLLHAYHNAMTKPQEYVNGTLAFMEAVIGAVSGTMVVGINALLKNAASSSVARFTLFAVNAAKHMFVYDMYREEMKEFIQQNFPTQFDRTSQYDNITERDQRYNWRGKLKVKQNLGKNTFLAALKLAPHLPMAGLRVYTDVFLKWASNVSNAAPEAYNAHAIWTAHYIQELINEGIVKDAHDFMVRKPVNKRAATNATDFVSRSMGYAPDKAGKGQLWNGSSAIKRLMSKSCFAFRQQSSGLAYEFQNNMLKGGRLAMMGKAGEAGAAFGAAGFALANSMAFRSMAVYLGATMIGGGLSRFFAGSDDEEKKKALLEAERRYTENSDRNNTRDFITETATTVLPVTTAAFLFEAASSLAADKAGIVISGISEGNLELEYKESLKEEVEQIKEQIKQLNKIADRKEKAGADTSEQDEAIEKLELAKSQLTDKIKFRYFTNVPEKAQLNAYGAYGFTAEKVINQIMNFVQDDLDSAEQKEIKAMLEKEFTMNDPLAGAGYASNTIKNISDFARHFMPSDWNTPKGEKLPTELFWRQFLKIGQNPGVVVQRARDIMAKEALKDMRENERRVKMIKSRWLPNQEEE